MNGRTTNDGPTRTRATRALPLTLGAGGLLQALSRANGSPWLALASGALLALVVVAVVLRPRIDDVRVERLVAERAAVGETVHTTLVLTNAGRRTSPPLLIADELPGHQALECSVGPLAPGQRVQWRAARQVLHRTASDGGVVRVAAGSPVGMLQTRREVHLAGDVRAWPAPAAPALLPTRARGGEGAAGSRPSPGAGLEVLGLRPFRHGDPARAVSARASARHGRPLVLEREREREPPLVVLVLGGARGEAWEDAVAGACALALQTLRSGRPLLLLGPPGPERPTSARQVRDAFAAADLAPALPDAQTRAALRRAGRDARLFVLGPPPAGGSGA